MGAVHSVVMNTWVNHGPPVPGTRPGHDGEPVSCDWAAKGGDEAERFCANQFTSIPTTTALKRPQLSHDETAGRNDQ